MINKKAGGVRLLFSYMAVICRALLGKARTTTLCSDYGGCRTGCAQLLPSPLVSAELKVVSITGFSQHPFPGCDAAVKSPRRKKGDALSYRASPLAKTVHRTVFAIHPLRSARSIGISRSAERDEGLRAPRPARPFEKGRRKLFYSARANFSTAGPSALTIPPPNASTLKLALSSSTVKLTAYSLPS